MKPELIETMLAGADGRIALWDLHMSRLQRSAATLGYPCPPAGALLDAVSSAIDDLDSRTGNLDQSLPLMNYRVRLLLDSLGVVEVTAHTLAPLTSPQKLAISGPCLQSDQVWLGHKTTHRPWYQRATEWLQAHPDYFDVLFINERGEVCEGTRSNVYVQINGQWLTPALHCGVLPGVWREQLLSEGQVREEEIDQSLIRSDTRIRLSNGLRGWFDVVPDLNCVVD